MAQHFVLIPLMAQGHMNPMINIARLFAERGEIVILVTTPHNASRFETIIHRSNQQYDDQLPNIQLVRIPSPCDQVGFLAGYENLDTLTSQDPLKKFSYASHKAVNEYKEAKGLGVETVPVLVGHVSYLLLSEPSSVEKTLSLLSLLPKILPIYKEVISELKSAGASWIQLDEPMLVMDLDSHKLQAFTEAYSELESTLSGLNVLIESYFADEDYSKDKQKEFRSLPFTIRNPNLYSGSGSNTWDCITGLRTITESESPSSHNAYAHTLIEDGRKFYRFSPHLFLVFLSLYFVFLKTRTHTHCVSC